MNFLVPRPASFFQKRTNFRDTPIAKASQIINLCANQRSSNGKAFLVGALVTCALLVAFDCSMTCATAQERQMLPLAPGESSESIKVESHEIAVPGQLIEDRDGNKTRVWSTAGSVEGSKEVPRPPLPLKQGDDSKETRSTVPLVILNR
jgi:hypothetical protein